MVLFCFVFFLLFGGARIAKFQLSVGWRGPRIFGTQLDNISICRHLLMTFCNYQLSLIVWFRPLGVGLFRSWLFYLHVYFIF